MGMAKPDYGLYLKSSFTDLKDNKQAIKQNKYKHVVVVVIG